MRSGGDGVSARNPSRRTSIAVMREWCPRPRAKHGPEGDAKQPGAAVGRLRPDARRVQAANDGRSLAPACDQDGDRAKCNEPVPGAERIRREPRGVPAGLAKGISRPCRPGAGDDITRLCRARIPPTPTLHNGAIMRCRGAVGPDLGARAFLEATTPEASELASVSEG